MDYLKSLWWKPTTKEESPANVEFSTITTSAQPNTEYFSIIHEVKNPKSELPSPTESFHTVKSTFNEKSARGVSNLGYTGSNQDVTTTMSSTKSISTMPQTSTYTTHHQHPQDQNHQLSTHVFISLLSIYSFRVYLFSIFAAKILIEIVKEVD